MKRILYVASEAVPFIKTGGLADVVGSLPKCFNKDEYDVRVILPKYMCMSEEWKSKMNYVTHFYMDLAWRSQYVGVLEMQYDGIQFYFIDNEYYFSGAIRKHLSGYRKICILFKSSPFRTSADRLSAGYRSLP